MAEKKNTSGAKKKKGSRVAAAKQAVEVSAPPKEEKKANPVVLLVAGIVLVALVLVGSWWWSHVRAQPAGELYNNFEFEELDDGLWLVHLEINGLPYAIPFHYHPQELEAIPVQKGAVDPVKDFAKLAKAGMPVELYITLDPDESADLVIAGIELARVLGDKYNIYNIPTKVAMTRHTDKVSEETPVVTCNNADNDTIVLWIKTRGEDLVALPSPNCIVLQATTANETIMVADRFVYELFGIM